MTRNGYKIALVLAAAALIPLTSLAQAHKLHEKAIAVTVANSMLQVTPSRDWNQLNRRTGKNTETWTLDGEQLNDITFYGGIAAGMPLVRDSNRKRDRLPRFTTGTLLVEVPELLERTYRTHRNIASFALLSTEPASFLGRDGVVFKYHYSDADELTRNGEGRAAIIDGKLYMMTFDAPRLHYFNQGVGDFRMLADSAVMR